MGLYADSLRGAKTEFDIAATCSVILGDDVEKALLPIKMSLSFNLGGMGAEERVPRSASATASRSGRRAP